MSRCLREGGDDLIRCHKCPHRAVIRQRYSGMVLCREHFQEDVQRKAREDLRQTGLFARRAGIMIELDGGRNSSALAYILKSTFLRRRDIDLQALVIEEEGGDKRALGRAADVAEQLEVSLIRKSLKLPEGE